MWGFKIGTISLLQIRYSIFEDKIWVTFTFSHINNNKLTSLLRNREKDYIEEQLELNKTNLTKCWMIIREIVGKGKPVGNNKIHFKISGK